MVLLKKTTTKNRKAKKADDQKRLSLNLMTQQLNDIYCNLTERLSTIVLYSDLVESFIIVEFIYSYSG